MAQCITEDSHDYHQLIICHEVNKPISNMKEVFEELLALLMFHKEHRLNPSSCIYLRLSICIGI